MQFPGGTGWETRCSAVILAGGRNSRMGGQNKAFLEVAGRSIIERLLDTLGEVFDEILLVTRQPEEYEALPAHVRIVTDIYKKRSSLTGIHAGLVNSRAFFAFVVACDTPFIEPALVRLLAQEIDPESDVIVSSFETHYEPLCAIYSKRCLPHIESQLNAEDFKIIHFFDKINLKTIDADQLKKADPDLRSFFNVNTPEAYRASLAYTRPK